MLLVRPRHHVEAGLVAGASLISIAGHNGPYPKLADRWPHRLDLRFDDVPCAEIQMVDGLWRGPTMADLEAALEFARTAPAPLIVHCEAGRSRSTGIALAILADRLGPGHEDEAVQQLMLSTLVEEHTQPNPLLVSMADTLLGREGRIWSALIAGCPQFPSWVGYWQRLGAWPPDEGSDDESNELSHAIEKLLTKGWN
jgi:predicted protein tyrosine phosphatase